MIAPMTTSPPAITAKEKASPGIVAGIVGRTRPKRATDMMKQSRTLILTGIVTPVSIGAKMNRPQPEGDECEGHDLYQQ